MWPRVTLAFFSRVEQSGATISWDALSIRHTGKVNRRGGWEGVRLQGLLSSACVTRHCEVGQPVRGAAEGEQQGALRDTKDRDPLKWLCDPPRTPPCFHTSHMDTSENHPWELSGSQTQVV